MCGAIEKDAGCSFFILVFHVFSPEVYQWGQASPSLVLWPPWNRKNLHHPRLCQAAVQGQRVQLHGVGGAVKLLHQAFRKFNGMRISLVWWGDLIALWSDSLLVTMSCSWTHQMTEVSMLSEVQFLVLPAPGPSSSKTKDPSTTLVTHF